MTTEQEMLNFINKEVVKQGGKASLNLPPILTAIVTKLFADPSTAVAPMVVEIAPEGSKVDMRTTYQVTTSQDIIDEYIAEANTDKEHARLVVEDGQVLIAFNLLEIDDQSITANTAAFDGFFSLVLSKAPGQSYLAHDEVVELIPEVTKGEIEGYKKLFNASFNKDTKTFDIVIGSTQLPLTSGDMILVNEDFSRRSNSEKYNGMWAYSPAKYICCPPWYPGAVSYSIHSAFLECRDLIAIDLHIDTLEINNAANAFAGCTRLEQIFGIMDVDKRTVLTGMFRGCFTLYAFQLHHLASDLDLRDCPQLSYSAFEDLIENASSDDRFTIFVNQKVKGNIESNPNWTTVQNLLASKPNISIQ